MPFEFDAAAFALAKDWLPSLLSKLREHRSARETEINQIADVFGDPVQLAEFYVEPDCQQFNPADDDEDEVRYIVREPVFSRLQYFFGGHSLTGGNQLFILGDSGMGKSSVLIMLKLAHLKAFWPKSYDCVLLKIGADTHGQIESIKEKRKTILLLDALDEDPQAWEGHVIHRLRELLIASRNCWRVVISCRTQFFSAGEDPFNRRGKVEVGGFVCPVIYLSLFSDVQIDNYLRRRFPRKPERISEAKRLVKKMQSLRFRPMLLAHIEDFLDSETEVWTEYSIYEALIRTWLNRESRKPHHDKQMLNIAELWNACNALALHLHAAGKRESAEYMILRQFDMGGRSLLNKNSKGEFRFSHYSIQEFLVARALIRGTTSKKPGSVRATDNLIRFLLSGLEAEEMTAKPNIALYPLNMTDANLVGADLRGVNLQGCLLSGAKLSKANLFQQNLQDATLRGADLSETNLEGAQFRGVDLSRSNLQRAQLMRANLSEANLTGAEMQNANLFEANLQAAILRAANLEQANLEGAELRGAELTESILRGSRLMQKNFANAKLSKADLSNQDLQGVIFRDADLDKANLEGADLRRADLIDARLRKARLADANLNEAKLSQASLQEASLTRATLTKADLSGANLSGADLLGANLFEANLRGAILRGANLELTNLDGADLLYADLSESLLHGARITQKDFTKAKLSQADLSKQNLGGVILRGANLEETNLEGADLRGADLTEAILRKARLKGANLNETKLTRSGLQEASLREAKLMYSDLMGSNLSKVDLSGADLFEANLGATTLREANLSEANLDGVDLRNADLTKANLCGSKLQRANLLDATLNEATLKGAICDKRTVWPSSFDLKSAGVKCE